MTARDKVAQAVTVLMGDSVNMVVKKTSTRIEAPPKKKHINSLLLYIRHPQADMCHLGECLSSRLQKNNWVITYKTLLTIHLLILNSENDILLSFLSSGYGLFEVSRHLNRGTLRASEMYTTVVNYANFLNQVCTSYRLLGKNTTRKVSDRDTEFKNTSVKTLFEEIEQLSVMFQTLLNNNINFGNVNSCLTYSAFILLVKEMLRIFSSFNNRIIYLLEISMSLEPELLKKLLLQYQRLQGIHRDVEKIVSDSSKHGLQSIDGLNIIYPSDSVVQCLQDMISQQEGNFQSNTKNSTPQEVLTNDFKTPSDGFNSSSDRSLPLQKVSFDFDPSAILTKLEEANDPSKPSSCTDIDSIFQVGNGIMSQAVDTGVRPYSCQVGSADQLDFVDLETKSSGTKMTAKDILGLYNTGMYSSVQPQGNYPTQVVNPAASYYQNVQFTPGTQTFPPNQINDIEAIFGNPNPSSQVFANTNNYAQNSQKATQNNNPFL